LVEELFLGGAQRDRAAGAGDLAEHAVAVGIDIAPGKAELREVRYVLQSGLGEITTGDLACAFEQMPDRGRAPELLPLIEIPAECMRDRRNEERRIGAAAGDHHLRA